MSTPLWQIGLLYSAKAWHVVGIQPSYFNVVCMCWTSPWYILTWWIVVDHHWRWISFTSSLLCLTVIDWTCVYHDIVYFTCSQNMPLCVCICFDISVKRSHSELGSNILYIQSKMSIMLPTGTNPTWHVLFSANNSQF